MAGIKTTWIMNVPAAMRAGQEAAEKLIMWAAPTMEARVKQSIVGWPSGAIVDTGAMLNSVKGEVVDSTTAMVSVGVNYAIYVEYGTYKMAARPFFQTALAGFQTELAMYQP